MRILVFSSRPSTRDTFNEANRALGADAHEFVHVETRLTRETAALAAGN